jgi:hypothetical protein
VANLNSSHRPYLYWLIIFLLVPTSGLSKEALPLVQINWDYRNFPLELEIYEALPPEDVYVGQTKVYTLKDKINLGKKLQEFRLKNKQQRLALVIKNKTDQDQYFYAVPHTVTPPQASLGQLFQCLCTGHVFKVPKQSVWVRIARLNIEKETVFHKSFSLIHSIIGMTLDEIKNSGREIL